MERRSVVTGLGFGLLASTWAAAQDKMPSPSPAVAMGDAEAQYLTRTMTAGSMSLATSRIALEKAKDSDVKEFAQFEVAEQETIADVLKGMKEPGDVSGMVKPPSKAEVDAGLDAKGKQMVEKLSAAKAGEGFDKEFVMGQMEGHRELLTIQEDYLKSGKNAQAITVAKLARGMIKEHLTLLKDIHDNL